jgi:RNA recognition motif-containing protein
LKASFANHGAVVEANVMTERTSGRSHGFGFVTMSTAEEAQKAIDALNGAALDGRNLTVNIARPKTEGGSGSGFRSERSGGNHSEPAGASRRY